MQAGHGGAPVSMHAQLHAEMAFEAKITESATPQFVVEGILTTLKLKEQDVLYDLGCGDGRFVITAAKKYGCRAVGIEIDPDIAKVAQRKVKEAGVEDLVTIKVADAKDVNLDNADVIVMYLFPDLQAALQPEIFKARCIASYSHRIPNVPNVRWSITNKGKKYYFYVWQKPITNYCF
jgi:SAM-dependent methyltransferase